jgi:hypothetical protein
MDDGTRNWLQWAARNVEAFAWTRAASDAHAFILLHCGEGCTTYIPKSVVTAIAVNATSEDSLAVMISSPTWNGKIPITRPTPFTEGERASMAWQMGAPYNNVYIYARSCLPILK